MYETDSNCLFEGSIPPQKLKKSGVRTLISLGGFFNRSTDEESPRLINCKISTSTLLNCRISSQTDTVDLWNLLKTNITFFSFQLVLFDEKKIRGFLNKEKHSS